MADYDVIVIGAGCGGLSAGAQLARQGRRVLVLEQSDRVGGCCSTFERDGFHFDVGASLIEDADLIDQTFQRLGTTLWDEVGLIACDPIYTVMLKDGSSMKYPSSIDASAEEIRKIAPQDVAGWYEFIAAMKAFGESAAPLFSTPVNTFGDMARLMARSPQMMKFGSLFAGSYQDVLKKYFQSGRVHESMSYQSFFIGLPPELAPGLFAIIPYGEHNGLYYSKGGMIAIPAALQRCGERFGMTLQLNTRVAKVLVKDHQAVGVRLSNGDEITAKTIVSNVNAKILYLDMIGEEHLPWLARIGVKSYEYAVAVPMLYLGVNYKPPLESHHTLATVPMEEMNRYWNNDYKQNQFKAERQFGIISWTSSSDPSVAPEGKHVIILILAPGPYCFDWDGAKPALIEQIVQYYSDNYIPGLAEHVEVAEMATPLDFERQLLLPEGAIYGLKQDITNETVFRPAAKSKSIRGLYLVGASTHPGGGVPTTISSGMIAADLIDKYEK